VGISDFTWRALLEIMDNDGRNADGETIEEYFVGCVEAWLQDWTEQAMERGEVNDRILGRKPGPSGPG